MKVLTSRWKMLLYACSAVGLNLLNLIVGSYLCSALIAKGFGPEAYANQTFSGVEGVHLVIPAVWIVFGIVAKVIDGVIDIPMASLTDNLKSRWGRRRPTILVGLIFTILAYTAFAAIPMPKGATIGNTVFYGVILCIFYIAYTLTLVSYYATFTEIVDNERDRNFISNVKSVCDIMYFILGYVVVAMLLKGLNIRWVSMIALPLSLFMLIPLFLIKEPSTKGSMAQKTKSVNLFKSIGYTFRDKSFMCWMVVYFCLTFGLQLFLGGINEYFSSTGMSMMYVMMATFAPVPFTLLLYNYIIRKKGFRFAIQYIFIVFSLSMASMFGISYLQGAAKMALSIVGGVISSFSVGALFSIAYSIPAQLAADDEKRTGVSHSAMYFAVQGLISAIATAIGTYAVLNALKLTGTVPYLTLISAAAGAVAFAFTFILPQSIVRLGKVEKMAGAPLQEERIPGELPQPEQAGELPQQEEQHTPQEK